MSNFMFHVQVCHQCFAFVLNTQNAFIAVHNLYSNLIELQLFV